MNSFFANLLTGPSAQITVTNPAGAYYHDHGNNSVVFTLDFTSDNGLSWTTASTLPAPGADTSISAFNTGIFSVPLGFINGIRFTDTPVVSNGFHGFSAATTFDISAASGAPEMDGAAAAMPMTLMMGMLLLLAERRKRAQAIAC